MDVDAEVSQIGMIGNCEKEGRTHLNDKRYPKMRVEDLLQLVACSNVHNGAICP